LSSTAVAPRARKTFSRLKHVLDLPNLIDIQKASFRRFLEEGLRETIDDISATTSSARRSTRSPSAARRT